MTDRDLLSSYILRMANLGRRTAFIEQGVYRSRSYSYAEIEERARAFTQYLRERQVKYVLLWARPGAGWAVSFYGCVLAGSVVVPVDAGFSLDFVRRVAAQTGATLLVTEAPTGLDVPHFLLSDLTGLRPSPDFAPATPGPGELAEIVYTSGTTAEPRGVMITHGNLLANLEPVEREIRKYALLAVPFRPLRFLHLIPLSHLFGQVMGLFIPQMLEGVVVFSESQAPAQLAAIMRERRVSVMVSVPQQLETMGHWAEAQVPGRKSQVPGGVAARWWTYRKLHRTLGWKMWAFVVGGAALPAPVEQLWRNFGFAVVQGYGLTETAPAITITHPFKMQAGSVGRRLEGVELRIAEDGEILVRGPNVSPGYFHNEPATAEMFDNGWLRTGDLGRLDAESNLIYLGRKKEVIVGADGLNVFPSDVELVLGAQAGVREAAVVAREVSGRSLVHAVVVPEADTGAGQLDAAVAQANQRLEPHQRIRGYSLWPDPELPRTTSTGKLQRLAIARWVNGQGDRVRVPKAATLDEAGMSSLDRVELLTWLETQGLQVDEERFAQASTATQLQEAITPRPAPVVHARWPMTRPVGWLRTAGQWLLLFPLLRWYVKLSVEGRERLRGLQSPVLFVANHQSMLDFPVILRALPGRWRWRLAPAMGPQNFRTAARLFWARLFFNGYLLAPDAGAVRSALRHAGKLAEQGYCSLLFPEGERTPDGRLHPFRPGVGVMVERLRLPVVPLRIEGLYEIWPVHQYSPGRGRALVRIGEPLVMRPGETAAQFTVRLEGAFHE